MKRWKAKGKDDIRAGLGYAIWAAAIHPKIDKYRPKK